MFKNEQEEAEAAQQTLSIMYGASPSSITNPPKLMFQDKGEDDTAQTEKGEFLTEETETISVQKKAGREQGRP